MTLEEKKVEIFSNYMGAIIDNGDADDDDMAADMAREWVEELTDKEIEEEYKDMNE